MEKILTGIATSAILEIIKALFNQMHHVVKCKAEWSLFTARLDCIKERIEQIENTQLLNSDCAQFVDRWLRDVNTCLEEAQMLVKPPIPDVYNLFGRRNLRTAILKKADELEVLLRDPSFQSLLQIKVFDAVIDLRNQVSSLRHGPSSSCGKCEQQASGLYLEPKEQTFGRTELVEKLEALLKDGEGNKIIGLVGPGGIGKTHLAQSMFNLDSIRSHFQHVFMVTLGRDVSLTNLQDRICRKICDACHRNEILSPYSQADRRMVFNMMRRLNFLLILDDVWDYKVVESFGLDGTHKYWDHPTSKILITTRDAKILKILKAYPVPIDTLTEDESWQLFTYHAFSKEERIHKWKEDTALKICKRCDGCPLALKVIGRAMATKIDKEEWDDALEKLKNHEIVGEDHESLLLQRLHISYEALYSVEHYLPNVRKCFLYFGAFPEDAEITVDDLMKCWVGEGLISSQDDPFKQTNQILSTLINFCLIEKRSNPFYWEDWTSLFEYSVRWQVEMGNIKNQYERYNQYEHFYNVHDLVRDLIFYISRQQRKYEDIFGNYMKLDKNEHCIRRISWMSSNSLPKVLNAPLLRVVLLDGISLDGSSLWKNKSFSKIYTSFYFLQVLSLRKTKGIRYLSKELGELKCLVVLDISYSDVTCLPGSLHLLRELKILLLNGTHVHSFPASALLKLENLQVLEFDNYSGFFSVWDVRKKFSSRRQCGGLSQFGGFFELKNLRRLIHLTICSQEETCLPLNIENMVNLKTLHIDSPIKSIEALKELKKLKDLRLTSTTLTNLPDWINDFPLLEILMVGTNRQIDILPPLSNLERLRALALFGCKFSADYPTPFNELRSLVLSGDWMWYLPESFGQRNGAFMHLRILRVRQCLLLRKLPEMEEGALPHLEVLYIFDCPQLKRIPSSWASLSGLLKLYIGECGIEELPDVKIGDGLAKLESIFIWSCKFKRLPPSWVRRGALPSLQFLHVRDCGIEELEEVEAGALSKLSAFYLSRVLCEIPSSWKALPAYETGTICNNMEGLIPGRRHGRFTRRHGRWDLLVSNVRPAMQG